MDVIYTHYSQEKISSLIRDQYGFETIEYCRVLRARDNNDMYQIKVGSNTYVARLATLKFTETMKELRDYEFEISLLNFLIEKDIRVVTPVLTKNKEYIVKIKAPEGERYLILFNFIRGKIKFKVTRGIGFAYGKHLARMHQAFDEFDNYNSRIDKGLNYWLKLPLVVIRDYYKKHAEVRRVLLDLDGAEELICKKFDKIKRSEGVYGLIHADFGPHNAILDYEKLTFLDFDSVGIGYRVFDVANCAETFRRHGNDEAVINDFYKGYESIRPIQQAEKDVMELISKFIIQIWGVGSMVVDKDRIGSWYVDMPNFIGYVQSLISWFAKNKDNLISSHQNTI